MPLTPADVRNKQFSTTRLRPGYDEEEVDAFLDEVEAELDRLIQENEELRAKLSEVLRGGKVPALNAPHAEAPADLMAAEPPRHEPERIAPPEPVMMPTRPASDTRQSASARFVRFGNFARCTAPSSPNFVPLRFNLRRFGRCGNERKHSPVTAVFDTSRARNRSRSLIANNPVSVSLAPSTESSTSWVLRLR